MLIFQKNKNEGKNQATFVTYAAFQKAWTAQVPDTSYYTTVTVCKRITSFNTGFRGWGKNSLEGLDDVTASRSQSLDSVTQTDHLTDVTLFSV